MDSTYRARYFEIVRVLTRHGIGALSDRAQAHDAPGAHRMRAALEELGPTFVKLGQILSTRPDLLPLNYIRELEKLQESATPFPFEDARQVIERELGGPPEKLFSSFDSKPMAAGSLGQVHRATIVGDVAVVVKVQRPGVARTIAGDFHILEQLSRRSPGSLRESSPIPFDRVIRQLRRSLQEEQDYTREASHLERFRMQFRQVPWLRTPRVYREYSSRLVLTMDLIEGVRPSGAAAVQAAACDPKEIAARGAEILMRQIFEHGFFHGDPHPGNLRILPGNTLCLLDYGLMGELPQTEREDYAALFLAFARGQRSSVVETLLRITKPASAQDLAALERDLGALIDQSAREGTRVEIGSLFRRFLTILSDHNLRIPPGLFLMLKAVSSMDMLGRALDPSLDFFRYVEGWLRNRGPAAGLDRLADVPGDLRTVLGHLRDGSFSLRVEPKSWGPILEPLVLAQRRNGSRIAGAILAGCGTIACAVLAAGGGHATISWLAAPCAVGLLGLRLLLKN